MRFRDEKAALRRACKSKTAALDPAYLQNAGEAITQRVIASPEFRAADSVFVYLSVAGEPDTAGILRAALGDGKRVYVPVCGSPPAMEAVRITADTVFVPGRFGIPEPAAAEETAAPEKLDLIVVPCVAAAENGVRLGHGGGFYDAFLARSGAKTLCLCFEALLFPTLPAAPHDVRMDRVVTERRILAAK